MRRRYDKATYGGVDVYFNIPFWFNRAGREVRRSNATDRFGPPSYGNTAENALLRLSGVSELCMNHQCWVKVRFTCAPALLPAQISKWQAKLNRFLERWAKTLKEG